MKKRFKINKLHKRFWFDAIDEWYPCFPGNKVEITVSANFNKLTKECNVVVSVWGEDDIGMERFIDCTSTGEATAIFRQQVKNVQRKFPNPISQHWLKSQGFEFA